MDINSEGVPVTRFDVVKSLLVRNDPLFSQVFDLIALSQLRKKKSRYYKAKNTTFTFVMKRLNVVSRLADPNMRVDRMWERLMEIALFTRNKKHRAPADILKAFIKAPKEERNTRLTMAELRALRGAFDYIAKIYRGIPSFVRSKFATDQPQFYTMITLLLSTDVMEKFTAIQFGHRLLEVRKILDGDVAAPKGMEEDIKQYEDASTKQTTHPARRDRRQVTLENLLPLEKS